MSVERIYIGGLDPPRLSGKDIIARLKSLDIELKSIEDKEKCFIHLAARSLGDQSALSIISQKYNNVKWKGCRLSVAEAKPHFLRRLEIERQERAERDAQEKVQKQQTSATNEDPNHDKEDIPSRIPRRLRIRKKFGDEAFHVDTRPFSVENWKNFSAAKNKLLKRAANHAQKALKIKEMKHTTYRHAPLEHRAVHIRFESSRSDDSHGATIRAVSSSEEFEGSESGHDEKDASVSAEDESASDESSSAKEAKLTNTSASYDWSDDDSDNDSSSDDKSITNNMAPSVEPAQGVLVKNIEEAKPQATTKDYQWSSDSSSDESSVNIKRTRTFQEVAVDDEFAAGLDDEKWNSSDEEDYMPASERNAKDAAYQMDDDVSANLGVLAELFPDMKSKSPLNPLGGNEDTKPEESKPTKPSMPFGIMPRYDPTAATSQKYEVKEEEPEGEDSEVSEESEEEVEMKGASQGESEDDRESLGGDDERQTGNEKDEKIGDKEDDKKHIYEEGKLENVFREARDAWQVQSSLPTQKKEESSTGAFSFGFELSNPEPKTETKNVDGGFSFGFDVPVAKPSEENEEDKKLQKNSDEADGTGDDSMEEDGKDENDPASNAKRRRGLHFSRAEMEAYEADFFSHNYGEHIMNDLEGFRNDPDEREQWLRERQTLTLDWKRKRKLAMSRIQKRVRHR